MKTTLTLLLALAATAAGLGFQSEAAIFRAAHMEGTWIACLVLAFLFAVIAALALVAAGARLLND